MSLAKIAQDLISQYFAGFDQVVAAKIVLFRSPFTTQIMKSITVMGSASFMIAIALLAFIILLHKKDPWKIPLIFVALTGAWYVNGLLKLLFNRSRPDNIGLVIATGYSFPSGHAMISFSFYGMLAYLFWINPTYKHKRWLITIIFVLLILAIGISRVYLGVHYPSDVIAGYVAGGVWLTCCILIFQTLRRF